ncbi:MAG: 50S ribosomal protein L5 [Patescibacteria group bacterium]|nr:50S ribosomal protein L5 [Patescibacteria group bacterium]MCL5432473.1 50S ribosomal protein L5 [Patescibacteria group bacterium]
MTLKQKYYQEIRPKLQEELGLKNIMAVPRLIKIVVNVGAKEAIDDKKVLEAISSQLATITGQKPIIRNAKKSVAAFKLREGQPVGVCVTLRGQRMYDFMEKLVTIVFPRVRDFHGTPTTSFDGHGNYSLGLQEQIVFPEIEYSQIDKIRGLEVTIATSARDDDQGMALLKAFGMPFVK